MNAAPTARGRIQDAPAGNFIQRPTELHMEILDTREQSAWQALAPADLETYQGLRPEPPFVKIGIGRGVMDEAWFRRSPGADSDGAMATREIDGHLFSFCARPAGPPQEPAGPAGPRLIEVVKHHTLVYRAGRSIDWLRLPDGSHYVHVIEGGPDKPPLVLPEGWAQHSVKLERELTVELPCPTTVMFFPNRDSFQGPVDPPS